MGVIRLFGHPVNINTHKVFASTNKIIRLFFIAGVHCFFISFKIIKNVSTKLS